MQIILLAPLLFASLISCNEELINAAENNDLEKLKQLLNDGADINYQDDEDFTPLMISSYYGHVDMVRFMLEKNARCDLLEEEERTALHLALSRGNLEIAQMLWERDQVLDTAKYDDENLLHLCCQWEHAGYVELAKKILERGVKLEELNKKDHYENTPLLRALKRGSFEAANLLIVAGSDVLVKGEKERTCLHFASTRKGFTKLVEYFLNCGIDIETKDRFQNTALHLALKHGPRETIKYLINRGANVRAVGNEDESPLHLACTRNDLTDVVGIILKKGVDKNARDIDGNFPLHKALIRGHRKSAWKLLKAGADFTLPGLQGNYPLHLACARDDLNDIVSMILQSGFNKNILNGDGDTPLNIAAGFGQLKNVKLLLDHGVDVHIPDNNGHPPIISAVLSERGDTAQLVRILMDSGGCAKSDIVKKSVFWLFVLRKADMALKVMAEYPETDFYDFILSQIVESDSIPAEFEAIIENNWKLPEVAAFVINNGANITKCNKTLALFSPYLYKEIRKLPTNFAEFFSKAVTYHSGTGLQLALSPIQLNDEREIFALYRIMKEVYWKLHGMKGKEEVLKYDDKVKDIQIRHHEEILMLFTRRTFLHELPMELISDIFGITNCVFRRKLHRLSWIMALTEVLTKEPIVDENGRFINPNLIFKHFENILF